MFDVWKPARRGPRADPRLRAAARYPASVGWGMQNRPIGCAMTRARTHAQGRLVSCLEGGYHLDALAESVQIHLETLLAG